ncbi:hypothetical protein V8E53_007596, partial [Lactarius tabidus]
SPRHATAILVKQPSITHLATITTSQQIPTILGTGNGTGDQAKVRCAATRIVGAPSSSTSLRAEYGDVGTYFEWLTSHSSAVIPQTV